MHTTHKHVAHTRHKQVIKPYIRMIYTQHYSIQESSRTVNANSAVNIPAAAVDVRSHTITRVRE